VQSGTLSPQQARKSFVASWDTDSEGRISFAEFEDYYSGVSAVVDDDATFEKVLKSSWRVF
jgi:hypothetical protein